MRWISGPASSFGKAKPVDRWNPRRWHSREKFLWDQVMARFMRWMPKLERLFGSMQRRIRYWERRIGRDSQQPRRKGKLLKQLKILLGRETPNSSWVLMRLLL